MSKSILQPEGVKQCYLCGRQYGLEKHHIMAGVANRKLSEKYGLWVMICHFCHTGKHGAQYEKDLNRLLKQQAQIAFENLYGHEKWMKTFMKNYI